MAHKGSIEETLDSISLGPSPDFSSLRGLDPEVVKTTIAYMEKKREEDNKKREEERDGNVLFVLAQIDAEHAARVKNKLDSSEKDFILSAYNSPEPNKNDIIKKVLASHFREAEEKEKEEKKEEKVELRPHSSVSFFLVRFVFHFIA